MRILEKQAFVNNLLACRQERGVRGDLREPGEAAAAELSVGREERGQADCASAEGNALSSQKSFIEVVCHHLMLVGRVS